MRQWRKYGKLILVFSLLLAMTGADVAPRQEITSRLHPLLVHLAAEQPDQLVRIIVQKSVQDTSVENLVTQMGGTIIQDLHIIHAFAVILPAKTVLALDRMNGVRWVSLDAPVVKTSLEDEAARPFKVMLPIVAASGGRSNEAQNPAEPVNAAGSLTSQNNYLDTLGVRQAWTMGLKGQGIGVAVIDSGISFDKSLSADAANGSGSRLLKQLSFNAKATTVNDTYGHGTHIAGIIGGNGYTSGGAYVGIAPQVNLISLKISDEKGQAYESDTVAALQWVLANKATYNIRVINLSINSTVEQSYHTSPLDAAAEILWFNGVVVVASAGNAIAHGVYYNTVNAAPANDPFILTVGASNELFTADPTDDVIAAFSAYGVTLDGFAKPDIIAPGAMIISTLSPTSAWATQYPRRVVGNGQYIRLSGTSMAAPMVAGATALLLQNEPKLTPDQVKYRLTHASKTIAGLMSNQKYPYLDVYKAITTATTQSANTGLQASHLLWTGSNPLTWSSVNWNSVNWNSVNWNSVNWNSVNWNSVNWNSVNWDE